LRLENQFAGLLVRQKIELAYPHQGELLLVVFVYQLDEDIDGLIGDYLTRIGDPINHRWNKDLRDEGEVIDHLLEQFDNIII
jgi:hypothetical protein